ncbi:hypothetical protein H5410_041851, partial [Solanum commersonii]
MPNDPLQHKYVKTINTMRVGRHEVQLERLNPSSMSTHSTRESEWVKAEVVIHAVIGHSRGTRLKRGKLLERERESLSPLKYSL